MGVRPGVIRRLGQAALVAGMVLITGAPVVADTGDPGAETRMRTLAWATAVSDEGVHLPAFIGDPKGVEVVITDGTSPSGVQWTRVSFVDPGGVQWTRTRYLNEEGGQRLTVVALDPSGVRVTYTVGTRPDGEEYVASSFTAAGGDTYVRRASGRDLRGVEWTVR